MQTIAFLDLFSEIELLELVESLKLIEGGTLLLPLNVFVFVVFEEKEEDLDLESCQTIAFCWNRFVGAR